MRNEKKIQKKKKRSREKKIEKKKRKRCLLFRVWDFFFSLLRSTHEKRVFVFHDCFGNDALGAAERRRSKPKKKKKKKKKKETTTRSFRRRSTKKHTPPCGAGGLSTNARR